MPNAPAKWIDSGQISPFQDFLKIEESFNQLFNEFAKMKKTNGLQGTNFSPFCEIAEEERSYVLTFDMPGVKKDQVKVEAEDNQISVRAERKEEKETDSKKKHLSELFYGNYARTFTLPGPIDVTNVDAKFENGVLTVRVPKTESSKTRQIPVH